MALNKGDVVYVSEDITRDFGYYRIEGGLSKGYYVIRSSSWPYRPMVIHESFVQQRPVKDTLPYDHRY